MNPETIPPLHPPRGEMPPGLWEQHGMLIVVGGVFLLLVLACLVWLLFRRRPIPPVPAETVARKELESLKRAPESGAVLSRVSQVVRHYLGAAFGLPPIEMTTTEFADALRSSAAVGAELAGRATEFLRDCDRRKFAPGTPGMPSTTVSVAEELVAEGERRQAELRQAAAQAAAAQKPAES
jgi:hypothetical protein